MIKKIAALLLALTLSAGVLSGCGDKKDKDDKKADNFSAASATTDDDDEIAAPVQAEVLPEPSLTIDGEEVDTTDLTVLTIDGIDISFDEFRFYYFYSLESYKQTYGVTEDSLRDNQPAYNMFLEDVISRLKQELVTDKLAADYGIELDDEDRKVIENNMQNAKSDYESEEAFKEDMQKAHLSDEIYEKMFVRAQTYNKVMDTLFANDGELATSHDDFLAMVQDPEEYAHEVHIMVPFYAQVELDDSTAEGFDDMTLSQKISAKGAAYANLDEAAQEEAKAKAKEIAEEALKRALDGEDFNKLVEEYGWDIGLEDPKNGYYMRKDNTGGYPKDLLDAAFALQPGDISDELVENDTYGYFIVKRLEPDMDYINENIDAMIASNDQPAIQAKFAEVMDNMEVTYFDGWEKLTIDSIT
ncbi:peptidylprolyl isomerase [Ruminococcus sp.]|uniref:peptidylprolyl isomerase n=1 Tax=Ruminococcus sp. TaxID=41978 RepID=UPI0025F6D199|nr:peptidylprolyl isomerase [Ruminococcus sp.]MBQ8965479.1 peptidylprolyl isomerase [Ruminococcus sp.]